jgi:predicted PurR-regulated permease PerM
VKAPEEPGAPLGHGPFYLGFFGALGALTAFWLGTQVLAIGHILVLIVVALFLAAGLNPAVVWITGLEIRGRRIKRHWALLIVISVVIGVLALFLAAIVPVIGDQIALITAHAPGWLDELQHNRQVQKWNDEFALIEKAKAYIEDGELGKQLFGGVLGFGLAVLSALGNAFVVIVLTLYFLASIDKTKDALYELAPASRRARVRSLGDRIILSVGGYVSGAFVVAVCAGLSSLVFLFIIGLGQYAVALAFTVALLDVIPMIGATIGAVVVTAIGFATDLRIGIACIIFYVIYQQVENYVIYPRVMKRSVDVPGSVTVIAALIGAALLGVIGAMLAIPTAAAILLLVREVFIRRQNTV